jgi:polysaccharide pyruvyl transferase WcaK-like protein
VSVLDDLSVASTMSSVGTETTRKRVVFVGDNRTGANWGRGASLALRQLLEETFEITGCIGGEQLVLDTAEAGYVGTLLPGRHYGLFRKLLRRRRRRPFAWYLRLEEWCGAKDFVADDPAVSIDRLLASKHRYPALARIYDEAHAADLIVLDGDGDIILSTPPRRQTLFLLAMMELGVRLGKPVFLVNSMISDCPRTGRNEATLAAARRLFTHCAAVAMRDPESLEYVRKEMPAVQARLIPDSLFTWLPTYAREDSYPPGNGDFLVPFPEDVTLFGKLDFSEPYICIGGGAMAGTEPERAAVSYGRLVDEIRELGYRVCLTENDVPDGFLRRVAREKGVGLVPANAPIVQCGSVLAHARLFISGRYHPSIFASLGGTPCIFLGTHAHKMGSLSRLLEYEVQQEFPAFPAEADVDGIVALARQYLGQGETLRRTIRRVAVARCEEAMSLPAFLQQNLNTGAANPGSFLKQSRV